MLPDPPPRVFISYARKDGEAFASALRRRLEREQPEITLWQDRLRLEGGIGWWKQITAALDVVDFMVLVMTPAALQSPVVRQEWRYARQQGVCVYPVKGISDAQLDDESLPRWMKKAHFFDLEREWQTFVNYLKSPCQAPRVPFMAPNLPESFVQRLAKFEQLLDGLLDSGRENPLSQGVALYGAGGFGKTTLAAAVCHDPQIISAFDDGILWVTLGEKPDSLAGLSRLYAALTGERPGFIDDQDAAIHLAEKLAGRSCLLVLDDVWDPDHLQPFLRGAPGCARLVTTRSFAVAAEAGLRLEVREMTSAEAVSLLTAGLPPQTAGSEPFRRLAGRLGEWPLMLELAGAALRQRLARRDSLEGALEYLNQALDEEGVQAFDRQNTQERNRAIANTLSISLRFLTPAERDRYLSLGIFPEDVDIPLSPLVRLWGLSTFKSGRQCERFAGLSLLRLDLPSGTIRLHDVIRQYLAGQLEKPAGLHARLLKAWGDPYRLPDAYAWRWFAYHMLAAGRESEMRRLLLDFDWLHARLEASGVAGLLQDFNYFFPPAASPADQAPMRADEPLWLVREAIRMSSQTLQGDAAQSAGQLLGRLLGCDHTGLRPLLEAASRCRGGPWLRPLTASLRPPGDPLRSTLTGHEGTVRSLTITPDGRYTISAGNSTPDQTVRIWDLQTGLGLRTIASQAEAGSFTPVGLTPDGRWALVGFRNAINAWEVSSGRLAHTLQGHEAPLTALAVSTDGRRAISSDLAGRLVLWDLEEWQLLMELPGHGERINTLVFDPGGLVAASASDQSLKIWDLQQAAELASLPVSHLAVETWIYPALSLDWENRRVYQGSQSWEIGAQPAQPIVLYKDLHPLLAISTDGRRALALKDNSRLALLDLAGGIELAWLPEQGAPISALAITPDGRRAAIAYYDHHLRAWDLSQLPQASQALPHQGDVTGVTVTPDGRFAVTQAAGDDLLVWDLESGRQEPASASRVAVLRQADTALKEALAQRQAAEKLLKLNKDSSRRPISLAGSPDDEWLAATSGHKALVAKRVRGKVSEDEETADNLLPGNGYAVKLFDLQAQGDPMLLTGHTSPVTCALITPDGLRAVTGSTGRVLRVWDLQTGKQLHVLRGHRAEITCLDLLPGGDRIVSAGRDSLLKVWDLHSGEALATFTGEMEMLACAVSPDGRTVVAGERLGRVHLLRFED